MAFHQDLKAQLAATVNKVNEASDFDDPSLEEQLQIKEAEIANLRELVKNYWTECNVKVFLLNF